MGPSAHAETPRINTANNSLCEAIRHAPVTCDLPGVNRVIIAPDAEFFGERLVPVLGDLGQSGLDGAPFVGTARHQLTLFPVPIPLVAKLGVRHLVGSPLECGGFPGLTAVSGNLHSANRAGTGPSQARYLVHSGA